MLAVALTVTNAASALNLGKMKLPGNSTTPAPSGAVATQTNGKTPQEQVLDDIMAMLGKKYTQQSTWFNTGDMAGIIQVVSAKYGAGKAASSKGHEWLIKPKGDTSGYCAFFAVEPYTGEARIKYWSTSNKACD